MTKRGECGGMVYAEGCEPSSYRGIASSSLVIHPKPICDRCGSEDLVKVKGCVRCEKCGYKNDCNGW